MVSVIVPVYRVEDYLPACLDSVLAQTYGDWECILVDDGSPDGSGAICDRYAARDRRFVVIHQENAGVSAARNRGLAEVKGEFFAFLDSDDRLTPDFLEALLAVMDERVDMAICEYRRVSPQGDILQQADQQEGEPVEGQYLLDKRLSEQCGISVGEAQSILPATDAVVSALWSSGALYSSCCRLYRTAIAREWGLSFDPTLSFAEDMRFATAYAQQCRAFGLVARPLYLYLWREGSLTTAPKPGMLTQRYHALTAMAQEFALGNKPETAGAVRATRDHLTPEAFLERMEAKDAQLALMKEYCALPNYREMLRYVKETRSLITWLVYSTRSPRFLRRMLLLALKRRQANASETEGNTPLS